MNQALTIVNILMISIQIAGITSCASLQQSLPPPVKIDVSRLSCKTNPELVDGRLDTISALGKLSGSTTLWSDKYRVPAGAIIKLDEPMYIRYIEVHTASQLPYIALGISRKKSKDDELIIVEELKLSSNQAGPIKENESRKIQIGKKILYLQFTTGWLPLPDSVSEKVIETHRSYKITQKIVQKPLLREIEFYQ